LYIKLAFEVLDLKNSNSFKISGLGYGNPYILNAVVVNSASGLPRVLYLGRGSKTRPCSDLHWSAPHLKFTASITSALQLFCFFLNRILTLFLLLASSGNYS